MNVRRLATPQLVLVAVLLTALLSFAAPARPASAAPTCTAQALTPVLIDTMVVGRHVISCDAVLASITVVGRLQRNGVTLTSQTATCHNASSCRVTTRYPKSSGQWRSITSGGTTGPAVPIAVVTSPVLNVP